MNTPKPICLIGGTSWVSTMQYYRRLNELAHARLGGAHSAELILRSIDYDRLKKHYPHGWREIGEELKTIFSEVTSLPTSSIILCNNTLHKAFDFIEHELSLTAPFLHIADLAAEYARSQGWRRVVLLGTRFLMEDGFYSERIKQKGVIATIPSESERTILEDIQKALSQGASPQEHIARFEEILTQYKNLDGAIVACTELSLLARKEAPLSILDPIEIQCHKAIEIYFNQ